LRGEYRRPQKVQALTNLRIELLGGFHVTVGARAVSDDAWRRRKPAALLKLLALAPGHRLHREQVMDGLWPELDPAAAAANLRKALHQARRAPRRGRGWSLVASRGEYLCLPPVRLWVNVDAFFAAVARARRTSDPEVYGRAVELYRDGLLPEDRYEEWAIKRREELQLEFLSILEELAGMLEARGDLAPACGPLQSGLTEDFADTRRPALWVPEKEHHDDGAG